MQGERKLDLASCPFPAQLFVVKREGPDSVLHIMIHLSNVLLL